MLQHMARQTECIERYFGQAGNQTNPPAQQDGQRKQGTLPSNTVPNPREQCNAIFTHSDTTYTDPMPDTPEVVVSPETNENEQIEKEEVDEQEREETEQEETIQAVVTRSCKEVPEPKPEPEPEADIPDNTNDLDSDSLTPEPEVEEVKGEEKIQPLLREYQPKIPYPFRLKQEKVDQQYGKYLDIFK